MLLSLVVKLSAVSDISIPSNQGVAAHALFLGLVQEADPALSAALHNPEQSKPFTVSSLVGAPPPRQGRVVLRAGQGCWLRFTSLNSRLSEILMERAVGSFPGTVSLSNADFKVLGVTSSPEEHPWAGTDTLDGLMQRRMFGSEPVPGNVGLAFLSPTAFRTGGHNVPLPLAELVFGSLVERWNAFCPTVISPDMKRYAQEYMAISRAEVKTQAVQFEGSWQVGFTGSCEYVFLNKDNFWMRAANLLAGFAFYSGVGYRTTMGMGMAREAMRRQVYGARFEGG